MFDILRRFGFGVSRGLAGFILLVAAGFAAAFWIGPLRPVPGELWLVVQAEDGRFARAVDLRALPADTTGTSAAEREGRYPLLFGVLNVGASDMQPAVLSLSLPAHFRLLDGQGNAYPAEKSQNNPLVRYRLRLPEQTFPADSTIARLERIDTIWLEPVLHAYQCVLSPDRVPEFVPTPAYDLEQLARIQMFYAFIGDSPGVRQTGLVELRVDPERLRLPPTPTPPTTRPTITEPAAPLPDMGALGYLGSRTAECGDPLQPLELHTVAWGTRSGGTFLVLYHGGAPRKYLFDLDGDDVAELEMWDPDGDGDFEARRVTRLPIPEYLLPETVVAAVAVDTLPTDAAWLARFHDTADGPFRFLPDSVRPDRRAVVDTTTRPPAPAPPTGPGTPAPRPDTTVPVTPPVRRDTVRR